MADKKIRPGCFRTLADDEARLLLQRHVHHTNNLIAPEDIAKAIATGTALKESGLDINASYSVCSPSPRALRTNLATQEGYGRMTYIKTDDKLSDFALKYAAIVPGLKAYLEQGGFKWGDEDIAKVIFNDNSDYYWLGKEMAFNCVEALRHYAEMAVSETMLITSHGVGRIEPGLMFLKEKILQIPARLIAAGQIIEVIYRMKVGVIEENWLEVVSA